MLQLCAELCFFNHSDDLLMHVASCFEAVHLGRFGSLTQHVFSSANSCAHFESSHARSST